MLELVVYIDSAFNDIKQNLQEILFLLNKSTKAPERTQHLCQKIQLHHK